jgi:hypothetical protein
MDTHASVLRDRRTARSCKGHRNRDGDIDRVRTRGHVVRAGAVLGVPPRTRSHRRAPRASLLCSTLPGRSPAIAVLSPPVSPASCALRAHFAGGPPRASLPLRRGTHSPARPHGDENVEKKSIDAEIGSDRTPRVAMDLPRERYVPQTPGRRQRQPPRWIIPPLKQSHRRFYATAACAGRYRPRKHVDDQDCREPIDGSRG